PGMSVSPATPAHVTRPSIDWPAAAPTASTALALPSGVDRSATISASWRSIPITRAPSAVRRATVAFPIPDADPVTTMVRGFDAISIGPHGTRGALPDRLVASLRLVPQPVLAPLTESAIF